MRTPTGCKALDEMLKGGIEPGVITTIYGGGGTGKTNICLQLARNVALNGEKVLYIDTEGVSIERLNQIAGDDSDKVLNNTLFHKVHSFAEQEDSLKKVERMMHREDNGVGMVIIDSFTIFYRTLINNDEERDVSKRLGRQMIDLMKIARQSDIPVVLTTQVYHSQKDGADRPLGGHILYHNSKTILELISLGRQLRQCTLIKHRSVQTGSSVRFTIGEEGIFSSCKEDIKNN